MDRSLPVWRDVADLSVLAALDPGVPVDLDLAPDVLVVGGGMVGLATASSCARAGLGRVVLVERHGLAHAASGRAAALLTPELHRWTDPPPFVDLARASLAWWRALDAEWGGALGVETTDVLAVLHEPVERSGDLRDGVELLDADRAHEAEPELGSVAGALRIENQARVDPLVAASAFASRAGAVASRVEMLGVETAAGRVTRVRTTGGDFLPGVVVFATGLAPLIDGLRVPQRSIKGHLLATGRAPFRLRAALAAASGLVLQLPSGEIVAGGTLDEDDLDPDVRAEVIDGIRRGLAALVPRAADLSVARTWCCFRPATVDHQMVIDRVPGLDNAWMTCGHFRTGILMAPATAHAIACWIATSRAPEPVAAFAVARFQDQ